MTVSSNTIDRIVANVLNQIRTGGSTVSVPVAEIPASSALPSVSPKVESQAGVNAVVVKEPVITAEVLEAIPVNSVVVINQKALVTPAGRDTLKQRKLELQRQGSAATPAVSSSSQKGNSSTTVAANSQLKLIVVRNSESLERLWEDLAGDWARELLSCPDDAAKTAISMICRGEAKTVLIVTAETYRAACFANRNDKVKAVSINDAGDVKAVRQQLRANVWCVDPGTKTYFELRNLIREITAGK